MNEYTEEQLSDLKLCSFCEKMRFFGENSNAEKCNECSNATVKCANEKCTFKRSAQNKYCNKHQLCVFVDETHELGKKTCYQHIRGCRSQLSADYPYSKCGDCLKIEREKDNKRRNKATTEVVRVENNKICSTCCKEFEKKYFICEKDETTETKTCLKCRETGKIQSAKRDKEHRNELDRVASKKPERIETKNQWKEANYEKVAGYWMKSKETRIEKIGVDEYWKQNAEQAKKWRDENPEKCKENNENKKNSIDQQLLICGRTASLKNLEFSLSKPEFEEIVKQECHYCGLFTEGKTFNGIDRKSSHIGYVAENCVPCCHMCNFIKGSLDEITFYRRVEHILTYNGLVEGGELCPNAFANHLSSGYSNCRSRAIKKELAFELTEEQFHALKQNDCYLCGKKKDEHHINGIDRFDNNIGYVLENCRTCCGECNYMKRNYDYDRFMEKLKLIYQKYISKEEPINNDDNVNDTVSNVNEYESKNIVKNKLKKTGEQLKEDARLRKQKQRDQLKERYGDEEYKTMRAKEIAEYRILKKKQEQEPSEETTTQKTNNCEEIMGKIREKNRLKKQNQRKRDDEKIAKLSQTSIENTNEFVEIIAENNICETADDNVAELLRSEDNIEEIPIISEYVVKLKKEISEEQKEKIREQNRLRKQNQRKRENENKI